MRRVSLARAARSLAEYSAKGGIVLLTDEKKKPVAAIVSLKNMDPESFVLSANPEFGRVISRARREARAGKTFSLDDVKREFGVKRPRARRRHRGARSK